MMCLSSLTFHITKYFNQSHIMSLVDKKDSVKNSTSTNVSIKGAFTDVVFCGKKNDTYVYRNYVLIDQNEKNNYTRLTIHDKSIKFIGQYFMFKVRVYDYPGNDSVRATLSLASFSSKTWFDFDILSDRIYDQDFVWKTPSMRSTEDTCSFQSFPLDTSRCIIKFTLMNDLHFTINWSMLHLNNFRVQIDTCNSNKNICFTILENKYFNIFVPHY